MTVVGFKHRPFGTDTHYIRCWVNNERLLKWWEGEKYVLHRELSPVHPVILLTVYLTSFKVNTTGQVSFLYCAVIIGRGSPLPTFFFIARSFFKG
jgi:hypothetical protein